MTKIPRHRFLVALDGSEWSRKTVDYLARTAPPASSEITLFHVFSELPECYRDLEIVPSKRPGVSEVEQWEARYRRDITEFMERSLSSFTSSGFPENRIRIDIRNRKRGIARDIIDEAGKGYAALVIGKKGQGEIPETSLGSVAAKLVETISFIPIILTDLRPASGRALIAVDGSPGSDRAVDYAAETMGHSASLVVLASVLRGYNASVNLPGNSDPGDTTPFVIEEVESAMVIDDAAGVLKHAGVPETAIVKERITGAQSRARALVQTAERHRCDTLILGRKGWSAVPEFSIGRVALKSLHTAKNTSVWII